VHLAGHVHLGIVAAVAVRHDDDDLAEEVLRRAGCRVAVHAHQVVAGGHEDLDDERGDVRRDGPQGGGLDEGRFDLVVGADLDDHLGGAVEAAGDGDGNGDGHHDADAERLVLGQVVDDREQPAVDERHEVPLDAGHEGLVDEVVGTGDRERGLDDAGAVLDVEHEGGALHCIAFLSLAQGP
jgi:hypothetical protein